MPRRCLLIDDERDPAALGCTDVARTSSEAVSALARTRWDRACFDNDLGPGQDEGWQIVLWMRSHLPEDRWPREVMAVTSNIVALRNIESKFEALGYERAGEEYGRAVWKLPKRKEEMLPLSAMRVVSAFMEGADALRSWFGRSKVVDEKGNPLRVYHGTKRPDRIGTRFMKSRATSGPMPYFTDSPDIASSYATGKRDTSLEPPEDYGGWFGYRPKGMRSTVPIDRAWWFLPQEQREKLSQNLPHVTNVDEKGDDMQGYRLGGPDEYGLADKGHWEHYLRESRGNMLQAAKEIWLNSGALVDSEEDFMEVLRVAGMDLASVSFQDPWAEYPGVVAVYLKIENPLDTSDIHRGVVEGLERAAGRTREKTVPSSADFWGKKRREAQAWIEELKEDVQKGTSHVWTSIPDWVTKALKSMGYDGIKDTDGKHGGPSHTVWLPFEEGQVKSATGNIGTYDPSRRDLRYASEWYEPGDTITLWHGTSSAFLQGIKKHGLLPPSEGVEGIVLSILRKSGLPESWATEIVYRAMAVRHDLPSHKLENVIYLSTGFHEAARYARSYYKYGGEIAYDVRRYLEDKHPESADAVVIPDAKPVIVKVEVPREWAKSFSDMDKSVSRVRSLWETKTQQWNPRKKSEYPSFESYAQHEYDFEVRVDRPIPPEYIKGIRELPAEKETPVEHTETGQLEAVRTASQDKQAYITPWYDFKDIVTLYHGTSSLIVGSEKVRGIQPKGGASQMAQMVAEGLGVKDQEAINYARQRVRQEMPEAHGASEELVLTTSHREASDRARRLADESAQVARIVASAVRDYGVELAPAPSAKPVVVQVEVPKKWMVTDKGDLKEFYDRKRQHYEVMKGWHQRHRKGGAYESFEEYLDDEEPIDVRISRTVPPSMIRGFLPTSTSLSAMYRPGVLLPSMFTKTATDDAQMKVLDIVDRYVQEWRELSKEVSNTWGDAQETLKIWNKMLSKAEQAKKEIMAVMPDETERKQAVQESILAALDNNDFAFDLGSLDRLGRVFGAIGSTDLPLVMDEIKKRRSLPSVKAEIRKLRGLGSHTARVASVVSAYLRNVSAAYNNNLLRNFDVTRELISLAEDYYESHPDELEMDIELLKKKNPSKEYELERIRKSFNPNSLDRGRFNHTDLMEQLVRENKKYGRMFGMVMDSDYELWERMGKGVYRKVLKEVPYGTGGDENLRPADRLVFSPETGETYTISYYHDGTMEDVRESYPIEKETLEFTRQASSDKEALPTMFHAEGGGVDLMFEALSAKDIQRVFDDLEDGKTVTLPAHKGYPERTITRDELNPSDYAKNLSLYRRFPTKGSKNPFFKYEDGKYVPALPKAVLEPIVEEPAVPSHSLPGPRLAASDAPSREMTPEESRELVKSIRAGDPRSKHKVLMPAGYVRSEGRGVKDEKPTDREASVAADTRSITKKLAEWADYQDAEIIRSVEEHSRIVSKEEASKAVIEANEPSAVDLEGVPKGVYALHVSGNTEYWARRLYLDYSRFVKDMVVITIKANPGDVLVEDPQYTMDPSGDMKAESNVLLTPRKYLRKGIDWKIDEWSTSMIHEQENELEQDDGEGYGMDPDYSLVSASQESAVTYVAPGSLSKYHYGIYKDPTPKDISEILEGKHPKGRKPIAAGVTKDGTVYAWSANVPHREVSRNLRVEFALLMDYDPSANAAEARSTEEVWESIDTYLPAIKAAFPGLKRIESPFGWFEVKDEAGKSVLESIPEKWEKYDPTKYRPSRVVLAYLKASR